MSNIEKIRQEILRRQEYHWEYLPDADSPEDDWTHNELCELGAFKELEHLEDFIDSLPEEKPSEDLKNTAQHIAIETLSDTKFMTTTMVYVLGKLQDIFIAGAEWQKKQDAAHRK